MLVEAGAGAGALAEVPAGAQPGAEVELGVFGVPQPVAPSSLPPIWYERRSGVPSYQNLPLAFKSEPHQVPSITRTADSNRKISTP